MSLCFFLSFFLIVTDTQAQTDISKLRKQLSTAKNDTNKINLYRAGVERYRKELPDTAYRLAEEGVKLCESLGQKLNEAYLWGQMGGIDRTEGRLSSAKARYQNALELYQSLGAGSKRSTALINNELGIVAGTQGNFDSATRYFLTALKTFEEQGDTQGRAQTYVKLGAVNELFDNLAKANAYYVTALDLCKQIHDTMNMVYLYNNMAIVQGRGGYLDKSLELSKLGLSYCSGNRYNDVKVLLLLNTGIAYKEKGDEDKALVYYTEALTISKEHNMQLEMPNILMNIALLDNTIPLEQRMPLLNEALALAKKMDVKKLITNIYSTMAEVYAEQGDYKNAYLYNDSGNAIKNAMFTVQKNTEIANMQALYDLDKSKGKVLELELMATKKNFQRNVTIVIACVILVALICVTVFYRRTIALNKALEKGKAELAHANMVKDKMFSIIGHDLRTPTHTIIGMLQVLAAGGITAEEQEKIYGMLTEQSEASLDTLNKLLLWGRRQIKGISLDLEQFEVTKTIESSIKLLHEGAAEKHIAIVNKVPEGISIYADVAHFDFIVRNLLSNGVKFSKSGSEVAIGVMEQPEKDFVCFYVQDHGVGIKPELLDSIFGLNSTSSLGTENEKGTGLGLVLCRDFAEQDGGKIWAESKDGQGSTFFFLMRKSLKY